MARYDFECEHCDGVFEVCRSGNEAGDPAYCPVCGREAQRIFSLPEVCVSGKEIEFTSPSLPLAEARRAGRKAKDQERAYNRLLEENRKRARQKRREDRTRLSRDSDMHMAAQIPRELYTARQRQFGKFYWQEEGKKALKRDGLSFDD